MLEEEGAPELAEETFTVGSLSGGLVRQFRIAGAFHGGLGARLAVGLVPRDLEPFYGSP